MAKEYLIANTLALLGWEALVAARLVCNFEAAEWRRRAAHAFLVDVCAAYLDQPATSARGWSKYEEELAVGIIQTTIAEVRHFTAWQSGGCSEHEGLTCSL